MSHCYRHDIEYSSSDCPRCLAEQRHEELLDLTREGQEEAARLASEQHEEHLRALEDAAYRRANPGDHQCPHCGYITLRLDFDRCPLCHGSVQEKDPEYWPRVHVELERRAKAAAEAAAERQKQKAAAEAKQRAEAQARAEASAAQKAFNSKSNFGFVLVLIVVAIGLAVWISQHQEAQPTSSSGGDVPKTSPPLPPEQLVDRGACPYEGCTYGERWLARKDVALYVSPPEAPGTSQSSLSVAMTIRRGTWVTTDTGIVLSKRHKGRVDDFKGTSSYGNGVVNGPPLRNGDSVSLYSYLGEGCWRTWIEGRFLVLCSVVSEEKPINEWWIRVKTSDGRMAWTRKGEALVSQEELNSEVASLASDTSLTLDAKLVQIDKPSLPR